jgi:proline iminopeptidase
MLKRAVPGRGEITAPALLLTTTGRKSGEKFIFPLF